MGENDFPTVISLNGALKEVIATSAPAGLTCRLAVVRGAGHVPVNSLVEGLRDLFDGWKPRRTYRGKRYPPGRTPSTPPPSATSDLARHRHETPFPGPAPAASHPV